MKRQIIVVFFILLALTIAVFREFFFNGLYPYPGDFHLAWFEPWKTDFSIGGTPIIPHKPIADDVFRQLYPFKTFAMEQVRNLQWPLWNPFNGAGMPLMATMHVGFLNPFNALFILFPNSFAWILQVMLQPFLLGICTYLYCKKIGLSFQGSLFSTIALLLSGFVITRIIYVDYIFALIGLPILLYLVESYLQNNSKIVLLIPIVILYVFTTTQPQIILYILLFTICYFIFRYYQIQKTFKLKKTIFFLSLIAIGIGLAGIQLLPTLELFGQANINPSSAKFIFDRFLLPLQHLITIAIPNYFGNQSIYNYWGSADYIETIASIGLIPLFFAFLSIDRVNVKIDVRKFCLAAIFFTIIFTLDWLGTRLFYSMSIPILSTGIPTRIFAITTFSISILAGYGFDRWLRYKDFKEIRRYFISFSLFILILLSGTFMFYTLKISCNNESILNCREIALRNTILEIFVFAVGMAFTFLHITSKNFKKIASVGIISLISIIGVYNSTKFLPFSSKETFLPQNNLIKELRKIKDARVFGLGEANIKTNFATHFKFYDPNYYDPLYNKRYGELVDFANNGKFSLILSRSDVEITSDLEPTSDTKLRRDRLFDLLSVKYLIFKKTISKQLIDKQIFWQDNNWTIVLNDKALPFSIAVSKFEVITNQKSILSRLFDSSFNPMSTVILEEKPKMSQTDKLLVASENYYPGWKAYVDNKETKILRANYTFRAIVIPQGKHNIQFKYEPESLKIGIVISLISLISLAILIIYLIRSKTH